ncbi:hypothetical protein C5167_047424 [Papaver somniferum]|uniref:BHLH domain-containing protein n=1 Tax=Papaver somniferum TaxID=3469 RepID=A0A4Y7LI24_PAPSO|nr:uncharacterized protein LOC113323748 [Papaver somniferum]RZC84637.1 hypothetical protein C5167_047424 [Papaver somniferum]
MEKFQGPTSNHHCAFGGNVDEGVLQQCHGNTSFNFSYGAPYFNLEEESFTVQEEQQQQEESNTNQQSSLSLSVPITSLEDKMPFLEMLKSVDSPYYSDPSPAPLNPHFKMLLTLQQQHQHQQDTQIPHFSGSSSSSDQSSMDYYYSHKLEASQPVAFQPQSCVTATKVETQAHSSIKSEDNKENGEQEHMEQLEQDHAQDYYYLSLHLESANNENNKTDNGELGGEPPSHSSPESLKTVSSPTTTCCLAETESCISPHGMPPSNTKSASKQALPAARLVTSSTTTTTGGGGGHEREKKKRKRTRPNKNREEVESQRMTHIAVERNRRRQMNDHLNALRSLMPSSFVQRGDQASIIGGAIDFVKELEQLLHSLEAKKRTRTSSEDEDDSEKVSIKGYKGSRRNRNCGNHSSLAPFLGFFSAPQYTSYSSSLFLKNDTEEEDEEEDVINEDELRMTSSNNINHTSSNEHEYYSLSLLSPSSWLGVDIEVVVVQTHVNLKILGPRKSGQLVRVIAALEQDLRLTILHLNVTSFEQSVLYSFNLKIEDDCKLGGSADEIATAVYQIFSSTNNQLHLIS